MTKPLKFNYRKFYTIKTKKELPKDYDVHHIDGNKNNNNILNLVAIPKKIHNRWHLLMNSINFNIKIDKSDFIPYTIYLPSNSIFEVRKQYEMLLQLQETTLEIKEWIDYRDFLLGLLDKKLNTFKKY